MGETRLTQQVLALLADRQPHTTEELAAALDVAVPTVRACLAALLAARRVVWRQRRNDPAVWTLAQG